MSRRISTMPDLCCIVTQRLVELICATVVAMPRVWLECSSLSAWQGDYI